MNTLSVSTFQSSVAGEKLTLVDFSAAWCPPCKALHPILEELFREEADRVAVYQVDVDEQPELASAYGVMSMPTVIFFRNGEPVEKLVGFRPKSVYEAVIRKYEGAC